MNVRDRWPFSRYEGWVRVDDSPYTADERRTVRFGSAVYVVGLITHAATGDWWTTVFAMSLAGVFVQVLFGESDE